MNNLIIQIVNIVGDYYCVQPEDGQKVYLLIHKAFKENKNITLSFQNVKILTTGFLNSAVGQLYKDYPEEFIKKHLSVSNDISESGKISLKRVVETAKQFYKDPPEAMQRSINEILGD